MEESDEPGTGAGAGAGGAPAAVGVGDAWRRRRGPLVPGELAEAAVLGDIALVFQVLGWFLPLGGALQVMSVVPIALLASRHRTRAAVVATSAVAAAGLVIGGLGLVVQAWLYGSLGIAVGLARRRGGGPGLTLAIGMATTGLPAAAGSLAVAAAFPSLRKLLLAQVNLYGRGIARVIGDLGARGAARAIVRSLTWVNDHWWFTYPVLELAAIAAVAGLAARYLTPLLDRLARDAPAPRRGGLVAGGTGAAAGAGGTGAAAGAGGVAGGGGLVAGGAGAAVGGRRVAPVPVSLVDVSFRYPGAAVDAVRHVSLVVAPGDLTVLVGRNGSGKSTLARLLAGLPPTAGRVDRPGDAGLGRAGGTALVFQRPESQVLGVRVRDDVVWGLPESVPCDVPALLRRVGLEGMADRETATLSGGELQRLAIAAALARSPRLVISDESTSMLDTEGHRAVVSLLGELARAGVAVVHVTHRDLDGAGATKLVRLAPPAAAPAAAGGGSAGAAPPAGAEPPAMERSSTVLVPDHAIAPPAGAEPPAMERSSTVLVPDHAIAPPAGAEPPAPAGRVPAAVRLRGVGHVYAAGTPWAHRALAGVDLDVAPGEGVVVAGANGSGKSTLAWVVSGLVVPSEGEALLGGVPSSSRIGEVGLGFQHARLQLLRPTVLADVAYGSDEASAREALAAVGFDPDAVAGRRVDELSGGEQRRVALAGILARSPVLVVLDEPLAGLDEEIRGTLQDVLARLRREQGVATIVVAHDLAFAAGLGDRLVTLAGGRIVDDRPVQREGAP